MSNLMFNIGCFQSIVNTSLENLQIISSPMDLEKISVPLINACEKGDFKLAKFLIDSGCDIEAKDEKKRRAIHWACKRNHVDIVKFLIKSECNLEACDVKLKRPIHYSCKQENYQIIKILIMNDCNIEARDENDWRPVHYATHKNSVKVLSMLIKAGCNIEARNKWNMRSIHIAAKSGNVDVLRVLLENNCNIEARDRWNKRAIHWAAQYGKIKILELLIKQCDIEACDKDKRKAIHWACLNNFLEVIKLLTKCQCRVDNRDGYNYLPIDISRKKKAVEIVNLLEEAMTINHISEALNLKCEEFCDHKLCPKSLYEKTFEKGELIGKGAFGEVFKCNLTNSNKAFVIKYISNDQLKYIENNINKHREKLCHPRIIQYFGSIQDDRNLLIFMEYLEQGSLSDLIQLGAPLMELKTVNYSKQILEGLAFLHKNHIIHRDIKPQNILLKNSENIKLADFGLSRELNSNSYADSLIGTIFYIAPEIWSEQRYKYPTDLWAVGITILDMELMAQSQVIGHDKWFNSTNGYGFINVENERKDNDVFVQSKSIAVINATSLGDGEEMLFDIIKHAICRKDEDGRDLTDYLMKILTQPVLHRQPK